MQSIIFDDCSSIKKFLKSDVPSGEELDIQFKHSLGAKKYRDAVVRVLEVLSKNNVVNATFTVYTNYLFHPQMIEYLIDVEDIVIKSGGRLITNSRASVEDLLLAYNKLDAVLDSIKALKLSPYENLLMAYNYVTTFKYKEDERYCAYSRALEHVLNSDKIVCVGYANLMYVLLKNLDIPCTTISEWVIRDGSVSGHMVNAVHLVDKKYNIDGYYYLDACWDSIYDYRDLWKMYNFCLLPFGDLKKLIGRDIVVKEDYGAYNMLISGQFSRANTVGAVKNFIVSDDALDFFGYKMQHEGLNIKDFAEKIEDGCRWIMQGFDYREYSRDQLIDPICFQFCLTQLAIFPPKVVVDYVKELSKCYQYIGKNSDEIEFYNKDTALNLYDELKQFLTPETKESSRIFKLLNSDALNRCLEIGKLTQDFDERAREIIERSKPIPLETVKTALKNVWMAQSVSKFWQDKYVLNAIKGSTSIARYKFIDYAENCFSKLAKNQDENDKEK